MKRVYNFSEGRAGMKDILGGKGANLAEMTRLGLPVPPGFTITTAACMDYLKRGGQLTDELQKEIRQALQELELATQKAFNDPEQPLLVSVRSGAAFSMPGMMDTILNLGLNDQVVKRLAQLTDPAFAYDCYRRLLQMFGDVVYGIDKTCFDRCLDRLEKQFGKQLADFAEAEWQQVITAFTAIYAENGKRFPEAPMQQLEEAVAAVFNSWNNHRAKVYRQLHQIPDDLGTAVNIQTMVFGNSGEKSGTGVAFTRNPTTGEKRLFGEFLLNAQGEDVVAGIRTPLAIGKLAEVMPALYDQFATLAELLETHYRDMQDVEFTIENEKLYFLQTRNGKRAPKAALKIAIQLVQEGLITKEEALLRIAPQTLDQLLHPIFVEDEVQQATLLAKGLPASPGAATGKIVFTAEKAKALTSAGEQVILLRQETSPEDIEGMVVSEAIVTSRGGMTSHAAVVARGMGTCCVTGCEALTVNEAQRTVRCGERILQEGELLSVDGSTGKIYLGRLGTKLTERDQDFHLLMQWADEAAQLKVHANAETVNDLKTALAFGAAGVGLARTEHMFFGEKRLLEMRRLILSESEQETAAALAVLLVFQKEDFYRMYQITGEKRMVIRLLDPPMHEFLPHTQEEITQLAKDLNQDSRAIEKKITALQESNPMLGHRGCRLGVTAPEIYQMQAEAIMTSALQLAEAGMTITPKLMIPLIAEPKELELVKQAVVDKIQAVFAKSGQTLAYEIGTMIELPRACLVADQLAAAADFFSFGTNDLTQMTYGFSRDDIGKFVGSYEEKGILPQDPFQTVDQAGVGALMKIAVVKARQVKPDLSIGVCGEVGGDPRSIAFFQELGVDYVSCSPYRVPIARLAAAQGKILYDRKENCASISRII